MLGGLALGAGVVLALTFGAAVILFEGDLTAPPTPPYLVLNLAYSFGAAALAGWVAGRLAPRMPLGHAAAVAGVMIMMSLGGGGGGEPPSVTGVPTWYGPVLTALMPVGALLGGWLSVRGASRNPDSSEPH